jgi:4-hydroxy-3-methylbut-2-enyl diphosphate reductase
MSAKTRDEIKKTVFLAKTRGFCAGVKNAINTVDRLVAESKSPVYVLHEIVHNRHVIRNLRKKGVVFVEDIGLVPPGANLVFSAHGVSAMIEKAAIQRGLKITDATCPIVKKIHSKASSCSRKKWTLILIGHRNHPETIGAAGRAKGNCRIVEDEKDVQKLPKNIGEKILCLTQTTLNPEETLKIERAIKKKFGGKLLPFQNNICYATVKRQNAVKKLASKCDLIFIIGSKNSSNSRRLKEIAEKCGATAALIEDQTMIKPEFLCGHKNIGISAGASAPEILVQKTVSKLKRLGWEKCKI